MHPVLVVLELGEVSRPIGTYGFFATLGVAVAAFGAIRAASRGGLDVGLTIAGVGLAVLFGGLGAYLTFGLVAWLRTGSPAPMWEGGGLVFFGSVPGAVLGLWIMQRWQGLDVLRVAELSAPTTLAAHALGRLGCFFGGCCYGRPFEGPWAVVYEHSLVGASEVPRHPSPLYEAAGLLVLATLFAAKPPTEPGSGRRAALWLAAYCVLRIVLELWRGDAARGVFFGASTSQWIGAIGLLVAAVVWRRSRQLLPQ